MTAADGIYVAKRETGLHTVTFWHAEFTVYVPAPGGGSYVHDFRCTHNHTSRASAQECEDRLARFAQRRGPEIAEMTGVTRR